MLERNKHHWDAQHPEQDSEDSFFAQRQRQRFPLRQQSGLLPIQQRSETPLPTPYPTLGWDFSLLPQHLAAGHQPSAIDNPQFTLSPQPGSEEETLQLQEEIVQRRDTDRPHNSTGMPDRLKAGVERLSGLAMDDVRVRYNSPKPAQMQALAYTQGTEIHIAPGQEQHLPHEAWHVVQQLQGRVKPTTQVQGIAINDDAELETEADTMGTKVSRMSASNPSSMDETIQHKSYPSTIQSPHSKANAPHQTIPIVQRYRKGYQPNLKGLKVPKSSNDDKKFNAGEFKRPKDWYERTQDALMKTAETTIVPVYDQKIPMVRCQVTKRFITLGAIQIGHIQNWEQYVLNTQPATVREAISAYNDLNNLRIEDSTANTSHDFEADEQGNFKPTKEEEDLAKDLGMEVEALNEYDLNSSFIDDSPMETEPLQYDMFPLTLFANDGSGAYQAFKGARIQLLDANFETKKQLVELEIVESSDPELSKGEKYWTRAAHIEKMGKLIDPLTNKPF